MLLNKNVIYQLIRNKCSRLSFLNYHGKIVAMELDGKVFAPITVPSIILLNAILMHSAVI